MLSGLFGDDHKVCGNLGTANLQALKHSVSVSRRNKE